TRPCVRLDHRLGNGDPAGYNFAARSTTGEVFAMRCLRNWLVVSTLLIPETAGSLADSASQSLEGTGEGRVLEASGLTTDGPAALEFFRAGARVGDDAEDLLATSRRLSHRDAKVRDSAAALLIGRGPVAVPALRQAANDWGDRSRADRARKCLRHIEGQEG